MVSSSNRNRHERLKGCFKFTPLAACRPSLTQSQGGSQKSDPIYWNRATSISRETIRPVVKLLLASSARAGVWGWWSGGCASVGGGGRQMALPVTSETWKCGPNCWQTAIGRILPLRALASLIPLEKRPRTEHLSPGDCCWTNKGGGLVWSRLVSWML